MKPLYVASIEAMKQLGTLYQNNSLVIVPVSDSEIKAFDSAGKLKHLVRVRGE